MPLRMTSQPLHSSLTAQALADDEQDFLRFRNLPLEIKTEIAKDLLTDDPHSTARNLNSLVEAGKQGRDAVEVNSHLRNIRTGLNQAGEIAMSLHRLATSRTDNHDQDDIASPTISAFGGDDIGTPTEADFSQLNHYTVGAQGPVLGFLSFDLRTGLVDRVFDWRNQDEQAEIVAGLGPALGDIQPSERTDLVITLLNLEKPGNRRTAIAGTEAVWGFTPFVPGGMGMGLSHLRPRERTALVRNIGTMRNATDRAASIGGLAHGFGSLENEQIHDLMRMIHDPEHRKSLGGSACSAISVLGPGLKYVDRRDCDAIAPIIFDPDHELAPPNAMARAYALGGAGPGLLRKQRPGTHAAFFAAMMRTLNENAATNRLFAGEVLAGWNSNLGCFKPHERSRILKMISDPRDAGFLSDRNARCKAISGIGAGLSYVPDETRRELVAMICDPAHPHALRDPWEPIAGMGVGLKHLEPSERSAIVGAAVGLAGREKALAIAGLGRGLGYLEANDRARLVVAASELSSEPFVWEVGQEQDERSLAMHGLASGAREWARGLLAFRDGVDPAAREMLPARAFEDRLRSSHSI